MWDNIWCLLHLCNKSVSNNNLYRGVDLIKMYICCVDLTVELSFSLCVRERCVSGAGLQFVVLHLRAPFFFFLGGQFWSTSALTVYDQNTFGSQLFWHIVLFILRKVVVKNGLLTKLGFGLSSHCRDWPDYEFRSECAWYLNLNGLCS